YPRRPTHCDTLRIWRTYFRTCPSRATRPCFSKRRPWAAKSGPSKASRDCNEGELFLCANRTGRVTGVSAAVWDFSVSGYRLLFRWLDARQGLAVDHALITGFRDIVG